MPAFELATKFNATVDDETRFPGHGAAGVPGQRPPGTPDPGTPQFRGNEGRIDSEEGEMEPPGEPQSR